MKPGEKNILGGIRKFVAPDHWLIFLAALIGCLAGVAVTLFQWGLQYLETLFSKDMLQALSVPEIYQWRLLPLMPMLGGLVIGLLCKWIPGIVRENGVSPVIEAGALNAGKIRHRTLWTCPLTVGITLGTGGSGGREGPIAQIGASIGSVLGQQLSFTSGQIRILIGCGVAAAIAASFNTPLTGVLFSLEIILADFTLRTFSPIIVASVIGTVTGKWLGDIRTTLVAPAYEFTGFYEVFFYLILGILCGVIAYGFKTVFFKMEELFQTRLKIHDWLKPAVGGGLVGLIALFTPEIQGNGYGFIVMALHGQILWQIALVLVFTKMIGTTLTLGSGGAGGIVTPSLFIGSMVGVAFGTLIHWIDPQTSGVSYALVGMGAVAGSIMQAPLTGMLMLIELTNNYNIILPAMTSCISGFYTYRALSPQSIFMEQLQRKGVHITYGRDTTVLEAIPVKDIMKSKFVSFDEEMDLKKILEKVSATKNQYFPVLNDRGLMTGIISHSDIHKALLDENDGGLKAKDLASEKVVTVTSVDSLYEALEKFTKLEIEQIPVVDTRKKRKVIGMLSLGDLMAAYTRQELMTKAQKEDDTTESP